MVDGPSQPGYGLNGCFPSHQIRQDDAAGPADCENQTKDQQSGQVRAIRILGIATPTPRVPTNKGIYDFPGSSSS